MSPVRAQLHAVGIVALLAAAMQAGQFRPLTYAEFFALIPRPWLAGFGVVFGLIIGSFLNVVIYRVPREMDISRPRSRCPHCGNLIPWYRNVPVFSWIVLRGRCGDCRGPISVRYPLVEAAVGVLFGAALYRWGVSWSALSSMVFGAVMLALALIDYDFKILPNVITLPGIAVGFALSFLDPRVTWIDAAIGIVVGGGLLYTVAWAYLKLRDQQGMGMGDVKMIGMIGAFVGWQGVLLTIFLGSLFGSVVGLTLMKLKGREWDYALPFGTFLALAAVIVDWGGPALLAWYWGLLGHGG
jgi:leader peptidase (prepilin peptidase)/N-methyltransferase